MDQNVEQKLRELKERLERGAYEIDPAAVAEAILRRQRDVSLLLWGQVECSYPQSGPDAPAKLTVGPVSRGHWTARPIQVIGTLVSSVRSIASRPLGGAQTQSS